MLGFLDLFCAVDGMVALTKKVRALVVNPERVPSRVRSGALGSFEQVGLGR
jgi:hypothetical protein